MFTQPKNKYYLSICLLLIAIILDGCYGGNSILKSYTLSYDGNGVTSGYIPSPKKYAVGDDVSVLYLGNIEREGFSFFGLNTTQLGDGDSYRFGDVFQMPAEDLTLYIRWLGTCKLFASDAELEDYFGYSVASSADGSRIVVSALKDNGIEENQGAIYIYDFNGSSWDESKIIASDATSYDYFGVSTSISADGNTIVVGSCYPSGGTGVDDGAVYVYKWDGNNWGETKLVPPDGADDVRFGFSVDISSDGGKIVSGAFYDDDSGNWAGAVYCYEWDGDNWIGYKLTASDESAYDYFGFAVSISGDGNTFAAGAYQDDDSGSVYIFKWNGSSWLETKLISSDIGSNDDFGYAVSLSADGNSVIVGAPSSDTTAYIYVYDGSNWNETKISSFDDMGIDFGKSVLISDNGKTAIIGEDSRITVGMQEKGSVYVYNLKGTLWKGNKIRAYDETGGNGFGRQIALSADASILVVGSPGESSIAKTAGALYVYEF